MKNALQLLNAESSALDDDLFLFDNEIKAIARRKFEHLADRLRNGDLSFACNGRYGHAFGFLSQSNFPYISVRLAPAVSQPDELPHYKSARNGIVAS